MSINSIEARLGEMLHIKPADVSSTEKTLQQMVPNRDVRRRMLVALDFASAGALFTDIPVESEVTTLENLPVNRIAPLLEKKMAE